MPMLDDKATLPVDCVFPSTSAERRTMYHFTGNKLEERQKAYHSMLEVQGGIVRYVQMNKPLIQNIQTGCLVWYFEL